MAKTNRKKPEPDFSECEPGPLPSSIQIVAITYADGREVNVTDAGEGALADAIREYLELRQWHRLFMGGQSPEGLRDVAREIAEAGREQVSDRNRRPGPRKSVSKKELLEFRDAFEYEHGKLHGWKKAACARFRIGLDALNSRLN